MLDYPEQRIGWLDSRARESAKLHKSATEKRDPKSIFHFRSQSATGAREQNSATKSRH